MKLGEDANSDYEPALSRAALAALARTCKAFHECALAALWRTQTDLDHLMRCLPQKYWSKDGYIHVVYPVINAIEWIADSYVVSRGLEIMSPHTTGHP